MSRKIIDIIIFFWYNIKVLIVCFMKKMFFYIKKMIGVINVIYKTISLLIMCFWIYLIINFADIIYKICKFIYNHITIFSKLLCITFIYVGLYSQASGFDIFIKKNDKIYEYNKKKKGIFYNGEFRKYDIKRGVFIDEKINNNVVKIVGRIKSKEDNEEIFKIVKKNIYQNEGLRLKAYNLKGEYYYKDKKKYKLYTICTGQTTIKNNKGKIIRYIEKQDNFTIKECNELFKQQYEIYNKLLYQAMTDKNGNNYYNTLYNYEIASAIELVWWMGQKGSIYITSALINYTKFRTEVGYQRLVNSFHKYSKKCKTKYKTGCYNRKIKIMNTLKGLV